MIDSSISNLAAAANRQDTRSLQLQKEANDTQVSEQASSQPMAASGVEAANSSQVKVASQPSSVVTRLGETTEEQPLYSSNRPTGNIIRPSIEIAINASELAAGQQQQVNQQQAVSQQEEANFSQQQLEAAKASPTRNETPSTEDVHNLSS